MSDNTTCLPGRRGFRGFSPEQVQAVAQTGQQAVKTSGCGGRDGTYMEKLAGRGALRALKYLLGKPTVARWRQMAAAKDPKLIGEVNDRLTKFILSRTNTPIENDRYSNIVARMGRTGGRSIATHPETGQYYFAASPRHLDAIDPTGWLRREFMATQGKAGYLTGSPQFERNALRRDRTLLPIGSRFITNPVGRAQPKVSTRQFLEDRLHHAYRRAEGVFTSPTQMRALPPAESKRLLDAQRALADGKMDQRGFSDAITRTLSQDMVNIGAATPGVAHAGQIVADPRGGAYPIVYQHIGGLYRLADHTYQSRAIPSLGFTRGTVFHPLGTVPTRPGQQQRVYYAPETVAHEMGHVKGGVLGIVGPRLIGGIGSVLFPGLRRQALVGRKPLAAALLNARVGPEYVANHIAFGRPSTWIPYTNASYDSYLLEALRSVIAKKPLSPEEYRLFLRNYLPNGVPGR